MTLSLWLVHYPIHGLRPGVSSINSLFILHLFYMSKQISLTWYIFVFVIYCHLPKYSLFWYPFPALILCLSCRKIILIHWRLYFELNNNIIKLSLYCHFYIFCQQEVNWILNWVPKAQQVTCGRGTRKGYILVSDSI
jgi:hypothetical protein